MLVGILVILGICALVKYLQILPQSGEEWFWGLLVMATVFGVLHYFFG